MAQKIYAFLVTTPPFDSQIWPSFAECQRTSQRRDEDSYDLDFTRPTVESYLGMKGKEEFKMVLPSFAQLRHPALPTSMDDRPLPAPFYEEIPEDRTLRPEELYSDRRLTRMHWIEALYHKLGTITHTVPDDAPEGTVPKPSFVPDPNIYDSNVQLDQMQSYLEEHFNYQPLNWQTNSKEAISEKVYKFLVTVSPFDLEFWPSLYETQRKQRGPRVGPAPRGEGPREYSMDRDKPVVESYLGKAKAGNLVLTRKY